MFHLFRHPKEVSSGASDELLHSLDQLNAMPGGWLASWDLTPSPGDALSCLDVGSSVPYFPSFPLSQIFLSVLWSVFRYLLENGAWKVWFCGFFFFFFFFFLFVTMRLPKCLYSIPIFCMMFYLDGLVLLGILSHQEFEDTALCLSSVPWCSWELSCHPDSQTFENNMFWSL